MKHKNTKLTEQLKFWHERAQAFEGMNRQLENTIAELRNEITIIRRDYDKDSAFLASVLDRLSRELKGKPQPIDDAQSD